MLTANEKPLVYLFLILAGIVSLLLFDTKVSLSGDDCDYIVAAGEFWNHFIYPGHHGSLYPIVLSPFVGLFGIKLFLLKSLSAIFIIASLWLFYKSFRHTVPPIILLPTLFLVSINPHVLFFASYTYSEPLFMLLQALFFYLFLQPSSSRKAAGEKADHHRACSPKKDLIRHLLIILVVMGMGLTRTIGFCVVGAAALYLIIESRWKDLLYTCVIFILIFGIFSVTKPLIWPNASSVQSFESLLAKNPYNLAQGQEDLPGLIQRFTANSDGYLSSFLYKYLGFRSSADAPAEPLPLLTLFTYVLFFVSLIAVFRKNRALLFTGLYVGILLFASFILLNQIWMQDRILMIYYPYILIFLLGGLYYLLESKSLKKLTFLYPVVLAALLIGTGLHAKTKISEHIPTLQQNLAGNDLYGLTPDWENFIKMTRWATDHLDKNAVIISRKPSMSYVYTGRLFHGMHSVPHRLLNDVMEQYRKEKDQYRFLAVEVQNVSLTGLAPFMDLFIISSATDDNVLVSGSKVQNTIIYKLDKSLDIEALTDLLKTHEMNFTFEYEAFLDRLLTNNIQHQIFDPDLLLKIVKENHIKYLLLPRIRTYTYQNTGIYINTVHKFINYIQLKYPNSFKIIHTIGKDEICELAEYTGP
jgi:hypothetical protein